MIKHTIKINPPTMKAHGPLLLGLFLAATATVSAASRTWSGATDALWSTDTNWDVAPVDGDALFFSGTANQTNSNDTLSSVGSIFFQSRGWTVTDTTGTPLTLNGGLYYTSSVGGTGDNVWDVDTVLTTGNKFMQVNLSAALLEVSGVVSGTGNIYRGTGSLADGVLYLSNTANTFTGVANLSGGKTQVESLADGGVASSLGAGTGANSIILGTSVSAYQSTLSYVGSTDASTNREFRIVVDPSSAGSTNSQNISNDSANNSNLTFTAEAGSWNWNRNEFAGTLNLNVRGTSTGTTTFTNSVIVDPNDGATADRFTQLTVDTAGTVVLNAANTYSGGTEVADGVLQLNNSGSAGTGAINVQNNNGQVLLNGGINVANDLSLSGSTGGMSLASDGGANEYSGNITLGAISTLGNVNAAGNSLTVSGDIDLNGNRLYVSGNNQIVNLSGKITGSSDIVVLSSTTNVNFTNDTNDFDGAIFTGVVRALQYTSISNVGGGASALGAATTVANGTISFGNGNSFTQFRYIGASDATTDRVLNLGGTGGLVVIGNSSASPTKLTFTGDLTRASNQTGALAFVADSGNTIEYSGLLSDAGAAAGLNVSTSGALILSGNNTYTGTTTVSSFGSLLVNGTTSGLGAFAVDGILGGNGTIGTNNANVVINGTLNADTLTMALGTGLLDISGAANLTFELGTGGDVVALTSGSLDLGSGVIGFSDFGFSNIAGFGAGVYTLFDTNSSIFGSLDSGDLTGSIAGFESNLSLSGNDLVLTVVPEPSTYALLGGLCVFGFVMMRRRR